ncbi:transcriptional regulator [Providencia alcalifaciens]|uniref:winged helix-turn-helix domain-containing protein n=1 Tax=Providencia TaxID=586 RepID=UPI0018E791E4|nr:MULTISPECIES: winged helix-turn-helix domain-containing protein [Providencia]EJD6080347.1 winged helix-turn-helix domain-containing protein [Providencia rettgeri]EJD6400008.1 winged helix-turn-helix domain-containing protein [Providencia rettgeri]EJD6613112.1 winged helix-turn-helix domain-containing protein [Providencia rettgeri]ELL9149283.1 winged helix-turn-helix domain-containing protein [Providencia rettgeri]ELR5225650.1 winged helix-turn-helix domain-containing protein [Providencia re
MIYILNNCIEYDSETGEIIQLGSNSEVAKLTPILNRIFRVLVENNNMIIPREELLKKVWDEHGLTASINTLNQYISALRKLLYQHLEIDNAILNIPKKGVILSSELIITQRNTELVRHSEEKGDTEKLDGRDKLPLIELNTHNQVAVSSVIAKPRVCYTLKRNFSLKIILGFSVILTLASMYNLFFGALSFDKVNTYLVSTIGSCPVYSFNSNFDDKNNSKDIDKHVKEFNLQCNNSAIFYYYSNHSNAQVEKQTLLTKCEDNKICISTRINW